MRCLRRPALGAVLAVIVAYQEPRADVRAANLMATLRPHAGSRLPSPVQEPTDLVLIGSGLALTAGLTRRRRTTSQAPD